VIALYIAVVRRSVNVKARKLGIRVNEFANVRAYINAALKYGVY